MSNHIAKRVETVDVDASEIKEVKDTAEAKEVKMGFWEQHPVARRRLRKAGKIAVGMAAVFTGVYAGNKLADANRKYYTISLTPTPDGGADVFSNQVDAADIRDGDTAVVTETTE